MDKNHLSHQSEPAFPEFPLFFFACPNQICAAFNKFNAGDLFIAERMGKDKAIRRIYCKTCGQRFSEREGSLIQNTKLPEAVVVRITKCLSHGCSIEATADICEVGVRTVERMLEKAGRRAQDFHQLQLERLEKSLQVVHLDELHTRVAGKQKKGLSLADIVQKVVHGFTHRWR